MTSIRRSAAEFVGTALLVTAVVGSGIMAERLSPNGGGLALLANSLATGGALIAVISAFGPVSGAHLNPVVTVACAVDRGFAWAEVPGYLAAQFSGGLLGVSLANVMFAEPTHSARTRGPEGQRDHSVAPVDRL